MKRNKWNIIFAVVIVSYTAFSALYTFVIPITKQKVSETIDYGIFDKINDSAFSAFFPLGGGNPASADIENDSSSSTENGDFSPYSGTNTEIDGSSSAEIDHSSYSESEEYSFSANPDTDPDTDPDPDFDPDFDSDDEPGSPVYFTDETVITETTYSDPDIYVSIETIRLAEYETTAYIADVRVSSLRYLKTAFANDRYGYNLGEYTSVIAQRKGAILAINGDNYGSRRTGYVIRNGVVYQTSPSGSRDLLAINVNGDFLACKHADVTARELEEMLTWQAFSFGPILINDGSIVISETAEVSQSDPDGNPRTAIGMIEPLHYVFVVSDGRSTESPGLSLYQLARLMLDYGVIVGYNLDGGGSSSMVFNGRIVNKPTADGRTFRERRVTDIVYIGY